MKSYKKSDYVVKFEKVVKKPVKDIIILPSAIKVRLDYPCDIVITIKNGRGKQISFPQHYASGWTISLSRYKKHKLYRLAKEILRERG